MKLPVFLNYKMDGSEKEAFQRKLAIENLERGRILAIVSIIMESIFAVVDGISSYLKVDDRFWFDGYLAMYILMILINLGYLFFISRFREVETISPEKLRKLNTGIVAYGTLVLCWGSVISLMDQKLYGELMAFMVSMITFSILCFLNNWQILIPYFCSVCILVVGLPLFQPSQDILIGHYLNLSIFVFISWLASRMMYKGYCTNYMGSVMLRQSNCLLAKEMNENKEINIRLAVANLQLKKLALIDELTGVPNRRSFWNYMDLTFGCYKSEPFSLSVLMIDIDFFKQFNDNYGHDEGDRALIAVAEQIQSVIRSPQEFFGRWGGEEFIYTLLNTDEKEIAKVADTIRKKVRELHISHAYSNIGAYVSVSIGTGTVRVSGREDVHKAIELADRALYMAKKNGRDCAKSLEGESSEESSMTTSRSDR